MKSPKHLINFSMFGLIFLASICLAPSESLCCTEAWSGTTAGALIGRAVLSPSGGTLGQIIDLLIDRTNGQISMVVLSGVPGFGPEFVAAPFGALTEKGDSWELNVTGRNVPSAPSPGQDPYAYGLMMFKNFVGLPSISTSIPRLWADALYSFYGQKPYWTKTECSLRNISTYRTAPNLPPGAIAFDEKASHGLLGSAVRVNNSKATAIIDDLIIHSKQGRVALLVVRRGKEPDDNVVAIPFPQLSMRENAFILNAAEERLAKAPAFDKRTDLNRPEKAEDIYSYFSEQPFWMAGVEPKRSEGSCH